MTLSLLSTTEKNSETDSRSQDKMSTKSKDSTGASVASSRTADEKGNENKSDGSQPQIPKQLEDSSDEGKLTFPSCPNESSKPQTVSNLGKSTGENEPARSIQSSISSERHCSDKGEANSDSGSAGNETSAKEDVIKLNDLLYAFKTALKHPTT